MTEKQNDTSYYKRLAVIGAVFVAIILIIITFTIPKGSSGTTKTLDATTQAQVDYEKATARVVKSTLNLYYVNHREYPISLQSVIEDENIDQESRTLFKEAIEVQLKEFDYSVKGDESAYKFTYISAAGDQVSQEGDYTNDYH